VARVSAIIASKDRPDDLLACIESLCQQTVKPLEVFVVDASSVGMPVDELGALVRSAGFPLHWRRQIEKNGHFLKTATWNRVVAECVGEIVLFLDDDIVIEPDYIEQHLRTYAADRDGNLGAVCGVVTNRSFDSHFAKLSRFFLIPGPGKGNVKRSGYKSFLMNGSVIAPVEAAGTGVLSVRRDVCLEIGFDEWFHDASVNEDQDFTYRLSRKYRILQNGNAKAHHGKSRVGRLPPREYSRQAAVNHAYFFCKNMSRGPLDLLAFAWAEFGMVFVEAVSLVSWRSVIKSLLGRFVRRNWEMIAGRITAWPTVARHVLFGGDLRSATAANEGGKHVGG